MKVSIIGLGLIGGSIALSLKNNPAYTISGVESNQMHADEAVKLGDQVAALEKMKSLISGIKDPAEKQRAIRDLEFLLLTPAEQAKLREERTNRRMPGGGPRF